MQRCFEKGDWNYTRSLHVTFGDITVNDVNAHPSTRMSPDTDDYQEHYQNEFDSSFDDVLQIEFKINQPIEEALDQQTVKKKIFSSALTSTLNIFSENSRRMVELIGLKLLKNSRPQGNSSYWRTPL